MDQDQKKNKRKRPLGESSESREYELLLEIPAPNLDATSSEMEIMPTPHDGNRLELMRAEEIKESKSDRHLIDHSYSFCADEGTISNCASHLIDHSYASTSEKTADSICEHSYSLPFYENPEFHKRARLTTNCGQTRYYSGLAISSPEFVDVRQPLAENREKRLIVQTEGSDFQDYASTSNVTEDRMSYEFGDHLNSQPFCKVLVLRETSSIAKTFPTNDCSSGAVIGSTSLFRNRVSGSTPENDNSDVSFEDCRLQYENQQRKPSLSTLHTNRNECMELNDARLPEPHSSEIQDKITRSFYESYHDATVACGVCDQFCRKSKTRLFETQEIPSLWLELLNAPTENDLASPIPPSLTEQYDVSKFFKNEDRFKKALLSPRGVEQHEEICLGNQEQSCTCTSRLRICEESGCFQTLKKKSIPKFAIANGNYFGQLPSELANMSFGSLTLVRPVQSFGRVAQFHGSRQDTVAPWKLTGHMYATKLDTPLVRKKIPMKPSESPVRVVLLSPFATKETAISKAKVAIAKKDYIIEPEKISRLLDFWKKEGNQIMSRIDIDFDVLRSLPLNATSDDVFYSGEETNEPRGGNEDEINENDHPGEGGPCLSNSYNDSSEGVILSSTATVADQSQENNHYLQAAEVLSHAPGGSNLTLCGDNIYLVRASNDFASNSDPLYLEFRFPDLLPYGRGGFAEPRKKQISRKALFKYMVNLSTRQFQRSDFVFPVYDMINCQEMATKSIVYTKLPSRVIDKNGERLQKGDAFGQISPEDIALAGQYKQSCAKAAALGKCLPPPPESLNGLGMDFFTQIKICTEAIDHSEAAAFRNRADMYAAHNNCGKADIWFTFCPKDSCSFQVTYYALGSEANQFLKNIPPIGFRLDLIGQRPVAPALYFEHVLNIVIEKIIGWDRKNGRPFEEEGIFGKPKAYLRVVEEQGRSTLHAHCLLWMVGHSNIAKQLQEQLVDDQCSNRLEHNDTLDQSTTTSESTFPVNLSNPESGRTKDAQSTVLVDLSKQINNRDDSIFARLARNLDVYSKAEIIFPETEMKCIEDCLRTDCSGHLKDVSEKTIKQMRRRAKANSIENQCLICSDCHVSYTCSQIINMALEHGFQRCFQREKLTDLEVDELIWNGLPPKPDAQNSIETDRWMLKLASIQVAVQIHDWRHRKTCFKSDGTECRYRIPHCPTPATAVLPDYVNDGSSEKLQKVNLHLKRRLPFIFVAECNIPVLSVLGCNNSTRYVEDQRLSYYFGTYSTKHGNDNEQILAQTLRALTNFEAKLERQREQATTSSTSQDTSEGHPNLRSNFSIGLGRLLSATRAATNGITIGAHMAAFSARGNKIFEMSHRTVILPLEQAAAFLEGQKIEAKINRRGSVYATIHDYVFRSDVAVSENLNFWQFLSTHEICKQNEEDILSWSGESHDENDDGHKRRHYPFLDGHPLRQWLCHRLRNVEVWPKYLGQRLPNVEDLHSSNSNITEDEQIGKREQYGKAVLIMFHPFRQLSDLRAETETWWDAFLEKRETLQADKKTQQILSNIQNYYESFCQSGKQFTDLDQNHLSSDEDDDSDHERNGDGEEDDDLLGLPICDDELTNHIDTNPIPEIFSDPFVQQLQKYNVSPLRMHPQPTPLHLTTANIDEAVALLKLSKKNSNSFTLTNSSNEQNCDRISNNNSQGNIYDSVSVETRIQLVRRILDALQIATFVNSNPAIANSDVATENASFNEEEFPSLLQHSQKWTLNEKQHAAFALASAALLQHIYNNYQLDTLKTHSACNKITVQLQEFWKRILPNTRQLLLHLAGSGGTGKSQVIQAIEDFARLWKCSSSLVVTASSGAAATLIGGTTLHSALGIGISLQPREPTESMRAAWSEIGLLFIDEFSMISPEFFSLLDNRLRQLKVRPNVPFGGVHVIFSGDFFQLPPVGPTIYASAAKQRTPNSRKSLAVWRGQQLWMTCLTDVVELDINLRQADPTWAESLKRWRINQPTLEDIKNVNSRFFPPEMGETSLGPAEETVTIVPENKAREQTIRFCEQKLIQSLQPITPDEIWQRRGVLLIQAHLTVRNRPQALTTYERNRILSFNARQLKTVGNLYCVLGQMYVVGINADVSRGIANGTVARLRNVVLKPHAAIRVLHLEDDKEVHAVYADEVDTILFEHIATRWARQQPFPTLPSGYFPLLPSTNTIAYRTPGPNTYRVRVTQFPCANAMILTGHKIQGRTVDSIILGTLSKQHQNGGTGWLYVVLSRVRALHGLHTLVKLRENPKLYKTRTSVLAEMERLQQIQKTTLQRLQDSASLLSDAGITRTNETNSQHFHQEKI